MAYENEFILSADGYEESAPLRDGSDYDSFPEGQPSLIRLVNAIREQGIGANRWNRVELVAIGKLGSPGANVSGMAAVVSIQDILNANRGAGGYHRRVASLLGARDTFRHIAVFVVKKM